MWSSEMLRKRISEIYREIEKLREIEEPNDLQVEKYENLREEIHYLEMMLKGIPH